MSLASLSIIKQKRKDGLQKKLVTSILEIFFLSFPQKLTDWCRGWSQSERVQYQRTWGVWPEEMSAKMSQKVENTEVEQPQQRKVSEGSVAWQWTNNNHP